MTHPSNLLLHSKNVFFSLAGAQNPSSCCSRVSSSLNSARYLLFSHRQRARRLFPSLILHGAGRRGQPIVCDLSRAGHSLRYSHGKAPSRRRHSRKGAPFHGKPANFGHTNAKKRLQTQKKAEIEEAVSKLAPTPPSEDCIARLFEQQPLRLQNNNATFQRAPQEVDTPTCKAPRMERENVFLCNGSSEVKSFNGDAKLKPDFSVKLLDILSSFKRNNHLSDVKSRGLENSQPIENKFREDAMQGHPQLNIFVSSESQSDPTGEIERRLGIVEETSIEGTRIAAPKEDERNSCGMLDSLKEDILNSSLVFKGHQDNQLAFEELGFSSESSDDNNSNEVENRQALDKLENVSLQHVNELNEHKGRLLSDLAPVLSGKGWSHVFPRHISRSVGSRSNPSKSSIPGLRSKYSKPDPKAKQQFKKPLQLLANFEEETELINRSVLGEDEDEEDDVTVQTFEKVHKQPETELEEHTSFDWWDSDEEDDLKCLLSTSTKLPPGSKVESSMKKFKMERETHNLPQLEGETEDLGSITSFESPPKQTETKPEECISFEWLDSEEEGDLKLEENSMFEWGNSDAENNSVVKEKSFFKWKDEDAEHNGTKNYLLSATSQNPISFEKKGKSTGPNTGVATSNLSSSSDPVLTGHSQADHEDSGSHSYSHHKFYAGANQKPNGDGLQELPTSVKFLEVPPWKSPVFPDFPFEINYSYSEIPKAPVLGFRDHFSPFAPKTMERPWTGGPHKKPRRHLKAIESFNHELERKKAFELTFNRRSTASKQVKSRKEVLGKPLTKDEIISLVQNCHEEHRQVNLGRDGLTHNMIHTIHNHWKRRPVCKIKCRGAPTLDMDNVCFHVEDKTGGQIIYRSGGTMYVFRGRHYIYGDRPAVPFMLFRPASPVYPKLVPQAPAGLTIDEAHQLRILGQKVKPLLKLRKNAVLLDLVRDVRDAFQIDDLVSLDYVGVQPSDYRQIGAKLMELVPCVLLSFRNNRIVLWRGRDLKPPSATDPGACSNGTRLEGEPVLESTDVEGSRISASDSKHKNSGNGFSLSEPHARSVDESTLPLDKEKISKFLHSDINSVCKSKSTDSSDGISEDLCMEIRPHMAVRDMLVVSGNNNLAGGEMPQENLLEVQLLGDMKAPSDIPTMSDDNLAHQNGHAELCADGEGITSASVDVSMSGTLPIYGTANCSGDDSTPSLGSAQWNNFDGAEKSIFPCHRLDDMWETALNNGLAVELEGVDLEPDLILHKATSFSEVASAGPVYTDKLVNRLRLFGLYKKTKKRFVVPLHTIRRKDRVFRHKKQPIENRVAKQASHSPKIEMPPRKALQTDDLVKKLECM